MNIINRQTPPIILNSFSCLLFLKLCWHNWASLAGQPLRSRRRKGLVTCYSAACTAGMRMSCDVYVAVATSPQECRCVSNLYSNVLAITYPRVLV